MKIFNKGMNIQEVMFACNNCGAVWSATKGWEPGVNHESYFQWKDKQPEQAVYYNRSNTGKTFRCECPNCHQMTQTPAALHNAYMNYVKELS